MKKYFILEIFPKLGQSFTSIEGSIEFSFEGRKCILKVENKPYELKLPTSSRGLHSYPKFYPVNLYIEKDGKENNPFIMVEKICDILSLATGNHIAYFSSRINEYSYFSGWGIVKKLPSVTISGCLKYKNSNSVFLDRDLLNKILKKIELSKYKERILASLHMNRLSKYKAFSCITEAITDCVNSVEALYMEERNRRSDNIDNNILPILRKKTEALQGFLCLYYPGSKSDLTILDKIKPYSIRSAFLHRGKLLEPASGDISYFTATLKGSEQLLKYNNFYKIVFSAILNLILRI